MAEASSKEIEQIDYLIVGGGISGLYCGNRLGEMKIQPDKIRFLEKSKRVGGLLKSEIVCIDGHEIKQEEGGMRFYEHHRAYKLAVELGLKDDIVKFEMGSDDNLNYFRGTRFTHSIHANPLWYKIFNTGIQNPIQTPFELLFKTFDDIRIENGATRIPFTPEEWQKVRIEWKVKDPTAVDPNEGIPLYKWDFEYLLRKRGLSPETIKMIQYSIGFRSLFNRNANAGFGFQSNLEFSPDEERPFYTLQHGYDQIAHKLHDKLVKDGTKFEFEAEVVKYCKTGKEFPIRVEYIHQGKITKQIECKNLIFAIPKMAILKLAKNNEHMKVGKFDHYVNSVISQSMVKINLYFKHQWWAPLHITSGPNYTDLKLGTVYPISPIPLSKLVKGDTLYNYPGSLTLYCDYENTIYWRSFQLSGNPYVPPTSCDVRFTDGLDDSVPASEMVVKVALDQLKMLFQYPNTSLTTSDTEIIPEQPVAATFTHWIDETYGDSIHAWKADMNDKIISPGMYDLLGDNIAIIGESYSIAQEWVEGSLNHTEGFIDKLFRKKD